MTDLRYLENHKEDDQGGWKDLLIVLIALTAIFCVFYFCWNKLPGAKTVDDVLEIQPPAHIYSPLRHQVETFEAGE